MILPKDSQMLFKPPFKKISYGKLWNPHKQFIIPLYKVMCMSKYLHISSYHHGKDIRINAIYNSKLCIAIYCNILPMSITEQQFKLALYYS